MENRPTIAQEIVETLKALVRPYIICSSWTVILLMWLNQMTIPDLLLYVGLAIMSEYGLERAAKRWANMKKS